MDPESINAIAFNDQRKKIEDLGRDSLQFSLLIKPVSADCNLHCTYCFYLEKSSLYPAYKTHRMSETVLEKIISSYMHTGQSVYSFIWQGGEPTLMGLEFFQKVTDLQMKYGGPGVRVANGLQTNGTLIHNAFAEHLARYKFLVGCSLDGPADIHDRYRRTNGDRPSHAAVLKGINALKRRQVEFNILVLVSQANVHRAQDVYRYLVDQGFNYHQYIPCVEFDEKGRPQPFSITGPEWGDFMCQIFDLWYPRDIYKVSVRYFDSILQKLLYGTANVCTLENNCCQYFVVEYNGDVYPCDFFVKEKLKLGNILEDSWKLLLNSPIYRKFGIQKSQWNSACDMCDYFNLCHGDCLKYRIYGDYTSRNLSWLCVGRQQFLEYTHEKFQALTENTRTQQCQDKLAEGQQKVKTHSKGVSVGRNQPCPCGSGKKFKKCCGR